MMRVKQPEQTIYSNRCWIDNKLQPASITFEDGIITAIHLENREGAMNVGDYILMPGVIDAHVHVNEPGRTHWEGFHTATAAAAAGGITTIIDMPLNADPVTTSLEALNEKIISTTDKLNVNCGFYAGLIPSNVKNISAMLQQNVLGIKCFLTHSGIDEFPNVHRKDLETAMPEIAFSGIPLLAHCELHNENEKPQMVDTGSYREYLSSRPKNWENDAVALMILLSRKYNCKVHIVHVSSAEALKLIDDAKKEGLPVTAETCPHYILFNAEEIPDRNTLYKCAPPIRDKANNEQLKNALLNGVLDFIASDHSPAPAELKEIESGNLMKAWGGIAGLQFLLSASWTALKDMLTLEQFIPLLTSAPASFLNLQKKGKLAVGYEADLTVWDPFKSFTVEKADVRHRHPISPYIDMQLYGIVQQTYVNGKRAYQFKEELNYGNGKLIYINEI